MEFTPQELAPIAEQMARLCVQKVKEQEKDRNIMELEAGIRRGLKQRKRAAKLESLFGWVEYERSYYASCGSGKGQAPLDQEYGLEPGEMTPGLARLLALAGSGLPFGESAAWLKEFMLLELSENSIRKETQGFGQSQEEVEEKHKAQSQDEERLQERLRTETEQPERLYGSLDGAHVRIEDPDEEEWREMKVGCWFEVEAVPEGQKTKRHQQKEAIGQQALRAKKQQYYCDILEVDQFADLFWATAWRAKVDFAQELVFLGDGAKWIWRLVTTYFPNAVQIVDWLHAEEFLEKVAKDVFPRGEQLWQRHH